MGYRKGKKESVGFTAKRQGGNLFAKRESVIMQLCASYIRGWRDSY